MIVPAPNVFEASEVPVTFVEVIVLPNVVSWSIWIAPKLLSEPESPELVKITEPTELNSSALFRELAIIVYYITGGYYRACRFTYVENLLLIVLLFERMSIFSSSKAK